MARKARLEVEGGLYHVITRGNDRQDIFHAAEGYLKFLSLLVSQKQKTQFFLYAYCLMTNHIHLLIERRAETVGRIMQRVLTGYSQWYNRRYKHIGHVFQGRHKAILCDGDTYLAELVRYIHLNPVRARMVTLPEDYPYSSHREYVGLEPSGIVDVDPLLRRFGHTREIAVERFRDHVAAGAGISYPEDHDSPAEARVLGLEEFVDDAIHRMGEIERPRGSHDKETFNAEAMVAAVESVFGMLRENFCSNVKSAQAVMAKEVLILCGRELGASVTQLAAIVNLDPSVVSRRCDAARLRIASDSKLKYAKEMTERIYAEKLRELHV